MSQLLHEFGDINLLALELRQRESILIFSSVEDDYANLMMTNLYMFNSAPKIINFTLSNNNKHTYFLCPNIKIANLFRYERRIRPIELSIEFTGDQKLIIESDEFYIYKTSHAIQGG